MGWKAASVDFSKINSDIVPATDNVFDFGSLDNRYRSAFLALDLTLGRNLVVGGSLTVEGPFTRIESTTLIVEDKNIELAVTASPTDALADGGGITLKGTTDKTIQWKNATNSWDFNQAIHVRIGSSGVVTASGVANAIVVEDSTNNGLSILTPDASVGRIVFGSPSDPFGAFMAWSFSGSDFAVGTSKIGANFRLTSDLETTNITLSGATGSELATFAKDVTINGKIKITGGNPAIDRVLTLIDANGNATWQAPTGGGWVDDGTVVRLATSSDSVGIGTPTPDVTALLDLSSTTKGFLPPRMTEVERDAIVSPAPGLRIHNTTVDKGEIFTGATWKTILTEDLGQVVVQESFASSNVRFFGELALPAAQGWTDTATGIATIDLVTQTVFGVSKQVVRHNDDSSGATTSEIILTAQNWIDIDAFGASYGGTARLDTVDGANGFFSGLQANAAENPLATGNRRYGIQFNSNAGNLRLTESDNTGNNVTMDGTSGNPLITFDEWFSWECVVPAGLGAAQFYINGILTTFVPVFGVNGGGLGTAIKVGSGSSSGTNRIVYHDNFGVTIYEEAATKTLAAATMVGDVAQINIPEGKRDYTIVLPDGSPRPIGSVLRLVANNLGGSISLENQNPAVPEVLYNGLRTLAINVAVKETIEGVNTVDQANVYLGFEIATFHVGGNFVDTTDQTIVSVNIPQVITFDTNSIIIDISHTVGSSVFTINTDGIYRLVIAPQLAQGSGSATVEFWLRKNGVDIPNSNVQVTLSANSESLPLLRWKEGFAAADTFEAVWSSNSANSLLDNITSLFSGPNIPSIMLGVTRVGSLAA